MAPKYCKATFYVASPRNYQCFIKQILLKENGKNLKIHRLKWIKNQKKNKVPTSSSIKRKDAVSERKSVKFTLPENHREEHEPPEPVDRKNQLLTELTSEDETSQSASNFEDVDYEEKQEENDPNQWTLASSIPEDADETQYASLSLTDVIKLVIENVKKKAKDSPEDIQFDLLTLDEKGVEKAIDYLQSDANKEGRHIYLILEMLFGHYINCAYLCRCITNEFKKTKLFNVTEKGINTRLHLVESELLNDSTAILLKWSQPLFPVELIDFMPTDQSWETMWNQSLLTEIFSQPVLPSNQLSPNDQQQVPQQQVELLTLCGTFKKSPSETPSLPKTLNLTNSQPGRSL